MILCESQVKNNCFIRVFLDYFGYTMKFILYFTASINSFLLMIFETTSNEYSSKKSRYLLDVDIRKEIICFTVSIYHARKKPNQSKYQETFRINCVRILNTKHLFQYYLIQHPGYIKFRFYLYEFTFKKDS